MTHTAIYRIDELVGGPHGGLLGYTDYWEGSDTVESYDEALTLIDRTHNMQGVRTPGCSRRNPNNNALDPQLSLVCEQGRCRYILVVDKDLKTVFQDPPIEPIGDYAKDLISDISVDRDGRMATFCIDPDQVKNSVIGKAIAGSDLHCGAVRIPFLINLSDGAIKLADGNPLPAGWVDDHRYQTMNGGHHHEDHNGDHDHLDSAQGNKADFRHGGVHPPGLAQYVVVEL